jgi:hypothetical protein
LEVDNPIFKQLYKLSEVKKTLVQTTKLLDVGLVELSNNEYASL